VVTRHEDYCYICNDSVPKELRVEVKRPVVSPFTNLIFVLSLAFTAYCFLGEHKLSLTATLAISSALLLVRIIAEKLANKNSN
jgi:uncharacterized membrane protein